MTGPFSPGAFAPEAALAGAAESFFELLKSFGTHAAGHAAQPADWTGLARTLSGQFEQWLRASSASSAAGAAHAAAAGFGPAAGMAPPGFAFAVQPDPPPGAWELLVTLAQLQGQLAAHWSEIANSAAQKFITRLRPQQNDAGTAEGALRLYELWVECAEEAYARTVRTEEFCRLQAQLTNTGAALLLAQRRYADAVARACGLPTREEADALQRQIRELRAELEQQRCAAPRAPASRPRAKPRAAARRSGRRGRKSRS
jgi:hypothetical protein